MNKMKLWAGLALGFALVLALLIELARLADCTRKEVARFVT